MGAALLLACGSTVALAADMLDSVPFAQQPAVDGINFKLSALGGTMADNSEFAGVASVTLPLFNLHSYGMQIDLAAGSWDGRSTYAGAAHFFWRDPDRALVGIYGEWNYISPEHVGRIGLETELYRGNWTVEGLLAGQFGQNVFTELVGDVNLAYYFTPDLRGALGYRRHARGDVATASFEYQFPSSGSTALSVFAHAEFGNDDYHAALGGVKVAFGTGSATTMIERHRTTDPHVKLPLYLSSVTRCAFLLVQRDGKETVCASQDRLDDEGTRPKVAN